VGPLLGNRIRANPTGRLALKIGIGVLGGLVVALGIVLIPFPGPGWAIVILGLAIWAVEFAWAKNLLEFTKRTCSPGPTGSAGSRCRCAP
jgi:uncharacterized protein (TIGR02611 family)